MEIKITSADLDAINELAKTNDGIAQALGQLLMLYALATPPKVVNDADAVRKNDEIDRLMRKMLINAR